MPKLDTVAKMNKFYKQIKYQTIIFAILLPVGLFILVRELLSVEIPTSTFVIISLLIVMSLVCVCFLSMYFVLLNTSRVWKKKLLKEENAIQEYTMAVKYHANLIGLEPVSDIEFRRKQDLPPRVNQVLAL